MVTCTFLNGGKEKLLFIGIKGDSLHFETLTSKKSFSCMYSDLTSIKINKENEDVLYFAFASSLIATSILLPLTIAGLNHTSADAGDPTRSMAFIFGIPLTFAFAIASDALYPFLPKKYNRKEWEIKAE